MALYSQFCTSTLVNFSSSYLKPRRGIGKITDLKRHFHILDRSCKLSPTLFIELAGSAPVLAVPRVEAETEKQNGRRRSR